MMIYKGCGKHILEGMIKKKMMRLCVECI